MSIKKIFIITPLFIISLTLLILFICHLVAPVRAESGERPKDLCERVKDLSIPEPLLAVSLINTESNTSEVFVQALV